MTKYFHSKSLDLPCKYDTDTGIVTVKELSSLTKNKYIEYEPEELEIIKKTTGLIDPQIHKIKSFFDGTLCEHTKLSDLKMKGIN